MKSLFFWKQSYTFPWWIYILLLLDLITTITRHLMNPFILDCFCQCVIEIISISLSKHTQINYFLFEITTSKDNTYLPISEEHVVSNTHTSLFKLKLSMGTLFTCKCHSTFGALTEHDCDLLKLSMDALSTYKHRYTFGE